MIRHCVMLGLPAGYDAGELSDVIHSLGAVADRLAGCQGFVAGRNIDVEGKSPDFSFGFTLDFDNVAALDCYANDAEHEALGGRLVKLCDGGENIVVYDLDVQG